MTIPIIGQSPVNPIAEFLSRYARQDNTTRQDRDALCALILVVEGMIRKQMEADGVDVEAKLAEVQGAAGEAAAADGGVHVP